MRLSPKKQKIALALSASASVVFLGVLTWFVVTLLTIGSGAVPMTEAPTATPSSSRPTSSVVTPSPSVSPTATPSPTPVETVAPMANIDGIPVHIEIRHESTPLVNTAVVPITLNNDGKLVPPAGKAGVYYSRSDWNTLPGNLDTYRGIVAGHDVDGWGRPDVFSELGKVKKGDRIVITYRLNVSGELTTAEFTALADARSAPKTDVVTAPEYQYIWKPAQDPGRYLTVLSCDLATANPGQHAKNNWVVDAIRTK